MTLNENNGEQTPLSRAQRPSLLRPPSAGQRLTTTNEDNSDLSSPRAKRPSILEPPSTTTSQSMRRAAAELMQLGERRSRRSIVDVRESMELAPLESALLTTAEEEEEQGDIDDEEQVPLYQEASQQQQQQQQPLYSSIPGVVTQQTTTAPTKVDRRKSTTDMLLESDNRLLRGLGQVPAILLVCLLNLMVGIPFGVSYFPVGWKAASSSDQQQDGDDAVHGTFPIQDKNSLGIRMFLFATIMGQIVFTFMSKFKNPIALQMVENTLFYHALAFIVIEEQGYGMEALGTLFFLFGIASVLVGIVFYFLGRLQLGRVVYFFPGHVLVGCIGGIGVFITMTALEVTLNVPFKLNIESLEALWEGMNLVGVVLVFEVSLRILDYINHDKQGRPRFPLLAPIFFCLITPVFYLGLLVCRVDMVDAQDAGYFFPANDDQESSSSTDDLWAIFQVIDLPTISWVAVAKSIPTLVALASFSLLHIPINIPAYGLSVGCDTDMNAELIAHGYSNFFSGLFGGLQNYMTYSNSILYFKSGGEGKISSLVVVLVTSVLFVGCPSIALYIPRCMAGTLLLHIGIDLFLEGVYDSWGSFDNLEYAGIITIVIVMSVYGMEAALIAGIIAALSTYAVQSITHHNPIRGVMTAATLRSSRWNRSPAALEILASPTIGRNRILILQLQGHLFFGNIAQITDSMKEILSEASGSDNEPWIVIMDFSLVIGMDSSAAHAVAKLKGVLHKAFGVEITIFVTGSCEGFPCEYALTQELSKIPESAQSSFVDWENVASQTDIVHESPRRASMISIKPASPALKAGIKLAQEYPNNKVCDDLDRALIFAEDILIARANPTLFQRDQVMQTSTHDLAALDEAHMTVEEERSLALTHLRNLCPGCDERDVKTLFSTFVREEYKMDDELWKQGDEGDSAKLLVLGTLVSFLEGENEYETIRKGNMIGELVLMREGGVTHRLTTVTCITDTAVLYSLNRDSWERLCETNPRVARLIDGLVIRYLAHRVQHVSNRIFETRCLPI